MTRQVAIISVYGDYNYDHYDTDRIFHILPQEWTEISDEDYELLRDGVNLMRSNDTRYILLEKPENQSELMATTVEQWKQELLKLERKEQERKLERERKKAEKLIKKELKDKLKTAQSVESKKQLIEQLQKEIEVDEA